MSSRLPVIAEAHQVCSPLPPTWSPLCDGKQGLVCWGNLETALEPSLLTQTGTHTLPWNMAHKHSHFQRKNLQENLKVYLLQINENIDKRKPFIIFLTAKLRVFSFSLEKDFFFFFNVGKDCEIKV